MLLFIAIHDLCICFELIRNESSGDDAELTGFTSFQAVHTH